MFNEQRIRNNFIEGLSSISAKMKFQTEKELKEYLWKQKDFYRLDLISEEENINDSFLKEYVLINQ